MLGSYYLAYFCLMWYHRHLFLPFTPGIKGSVGLLTLGWKEGAAPQELQAGVLGLGLKAEV